MNAMLVFVMAAEGIFAAFVNGWYYEDPRNSLVRTNVYDLYCIKNCIQYSDKLFNETSDKQH